MEAVILLGAPGAGKGTAAEGIKAATSYIHVSTGDILRETIREGRAAGREAKIYMDKGELVPDDVVLELVTELLEAGPPDARYLFDGFPRTLQQARMFDEVLAKEKATLNYVFMMDAAIPDLVKRMAGRRICKACGAVYHLIHLPPRKEGECDVCAGELYQRPDDTEETVLNRLDIFHNQTASLVDYYEKQGNLVRIDAGGDKNDTIKTILSYLTPIGRTTS